MRQLHWNGERGAVECRLVCSEDRQGSYSPGSVLEAIADQCHRQSTGWLTGHNYCSMESYSTKLRDVTYCKVHQSWQKRTV